MTGNDMILCGIYGNTGVPLCHLLDDGLRAREGCTPLIMTCFKGMNNNCLNCGEVPGGLVLSKQLTAIFLAKLIYQSASNRIVVKTIFQSECCLFWQTKILFSTDSVGKMVVGSVAPQSLVKLMPNSANNVAQMLFYSALWIEIADEYLPYPM